MDFADLSPPGSPKTFYALVIVDAASRYTFVFCIPKQNQAYAIECLERLSLQCIPQNIICDNDTIFNGNEVRKYLRDKQIKVFPSTAYHHEENGLAENKIKILKSKLGKAITSGHELNASTVALIVSRINETPNATLGISPYEAWHGCKPVFRLPKYVTQDIDQYAKLPQAVIEHNEKRKA